MKVLVLIAILFSFSAIAAKDSCGVSAFIKSAEGQEKMVHMLERTKSLIYSKLHDFDLKEKDVEIEAKLPKTISEAKGKLLTVKISSVSQLNIWGESLSLEKISKKVQLDDSIDDVCGLEITFFGGKLQNKNTGQDYGTLGKVTEFIRLN